MAKKQSRNLSAAQIEPTGLGQGPLSRRAFISGTTVGGVGALALTTAGRTSQVQAHPRQPKLRVPGPEIIQEQTLANTGQAKWLWYPSGRTLPNTFVLFRRSFYVTGQIKTARAFISADSRYSLSVNGKRVGFGPAPCDPRFVEMDTIDVTDALSTGENVIGATVLFYGLGDGTWAMGKPGFLFHIEVEQDDGKKVIVSSDGKWQCHLGKGWRLGQYKRWYLRALQEEFDARKHPHGWDTPGFKMDGDKDWHSAMELDVPSDRPPIVGSYRDYMGDAKADLKSTRLRPRLIKPMREDFHAGKLLQSHQVKWRISPEEYFAYETPNACTRGASKIAADLGNGRHRIDLNGEDGAALTFALPEQMVGFPSFHINAPAGATVELMIQEGTDPDGPAIMNTHRHSWSRFICRAGANEFSTFDYECCRFIQLHIHGPRGRVVVDRVGMRRRSYPFSQPAKLHSGDPVFDKIIAANLNTLVNAAQETLVDGMGRERQQYSGDVGHIVQALHQVHGEHDLCARFIQTFSTGLTSSGYFLDCWPAYDRLARLAQREMGVTPWGPILDHSVGFVFDCYHHLMHSGRTEDLQEAYPRLVAAAQYIANMQGKGGLLPVDDLGVPTVWMDHNAFTKPAHRQCAFNLYAAAMLMHALPPLAKAMGDSLTGRWATQEGRKILRATQRAFWNPRRKLFVCNQPWARQEGQERLDDRSLSQAILFGQNPGKQNRESIAALADLPENLGRQYPANVVWPMWALFAGARPDAVVADLHTRWATMRSVNENNTLSEHWTVVPDTRSQWSHAPMAPLLALVQGFAGIRPLKPGYEQIEYRPQPGPLEDIDVTAHTPKGDTRVVCKGAQGARTLIIERPAGMPARLWVDAREKLPFNGGKEGRYTLPDQTRIEVTLAFT